MRVFCIRVVKAMCGCMYVFQPDPIEQKVKHAYFFVMDGLFMFESQIGADENQWFHCECVVYIWTNYTELVVK